MIQTPSDTLRAHYAKTALARIGIPFERGIQIAGVRQAIDGAIKAEARRAAANTRQAAA